jgi:hypothetical protein
MGRAGDTRRPGDSVSARPSGAVRARQLAGAVAVVLTLALLAPLGLSAASAEIAPTTSWKGFGVGNWPGASWRPYADTSPFNATTDGVAVHPNSEAMVKAALQWGPPGNLVDAAGAANDWSRPTYYAQPGDPIFTLHATGPGLSQVEGMRIPIPDAARPAGAGDAQMTVVTPDGWEYDFWQVQSKPQGGGTLAFVRGGRTRIDGDGLGSEGTAARFGNLAGAIRAQELAAGHIHHALYIVLKCTGTGTSFGDGVQEDPTPGNGSYVFPAAAGGSDCGQSNANLPPLGARFRLAMSGIEIGALPVPSWKKTILRALSRYGGYVGGTGGPGFGFLLEDSTMYTALGAADPLAEFAERNELPTWNGQYVFNVAPGVEWGQRLRVLVPPHEVEAPEEPETEPEPSEPPPSEEPEGGSGSGSGWDGFGGGVLPGPGWRPYASISPFNTTTEGASVHPNSQAIVEKVLSWGLPGNLVAGTSGTKDDWGHPTFYALPSDPIFTLHATATSYSPIEGMKIRVPKQARPAGSEDGHMTVVTPDGWEYDFWQVHEKNLSTGTLTFSNGGRTRIDGDGLGSGATAARFGSLAGMIRGPELQAGHINHALFIVLKCAAKGTGFGYGATATSYGSSFVYPAMHGGSACASEEANAPPLGTRLKLAMSDLQIEALLVPAWKKTILKALAHYGGYVGDTGGPGFAFMFESGTSYTALGLTDPLVTLATLDLLPIWNGDYVFNMAGGVDWARYLRILTPPPS